MRRHILLPSFPQRSSLDLVRCSRLRCKVYLGSPCLARQIIWYVWAIVHPSSWEGSHSNPTNDLCGLLMQTEVLVMYKSQTHYVICQRLPFSVTQSLQSYEAMPQSQPGRDKTGSKTDVTCVFTASKDSHVALFSFALLLLLLQHCSTDTGHARSVKT
jgi:hypothetical protein